MALNLDEQKLAQQQVADDALSNRADERRGRSLTMSRLNFLKWGVAGTFGLLGIRLWNMQMNQSQKATTADPGYFRLIQTKSQRGVIFDGKNNIIASNIATYQVVITPANLPQITAKLNTNEGKQQVAARQQVYDDLARFVGMTYSLGVIPEQVNGDKGSKVALQRNVTINALSVKLNISALDIDKMLNNAVANGTDKNFLTLNQTPILLEDFTKYLGLRELDGVFFVSEGQKAVLLSVAIRPEYEPVVVWDNKDFKREDALKLEERRFDMPGMSIQTGFKRSYVDPRLYSHILGYTGRFVDTDEYQKANADALKEEGLISATQTDSTAETAARLTFYAPDDRIGRAGIEYTMERHLRGSKGGREVEVDVSNRIVNTVPNSERIPQDGANVYLTIDRDIQNAAITALEQAISEANKVKKDPKQKAVKSASAVVLDAKTGEVKALVSIPTYDNNLFNSNLSQKDVDDLFDQNDPKTTNYAISGGFAPGSTFKLITACAGLQEHNIDLNTKYNCSHYIYVPITRQPVPTNTFKCWWTHGPLSVVGAIENSCDIFFYNVAGPVGQDEQTGAELRYFEGTALNSPPIKFKGIGIKPLNKYMEMFGLGAKTEIELPNEFKGVLPGPDWATTVRKTYWSLGDTMVTSIGQGETLMSPLQVANMTLAIATGKLMKPRIIRKVTTKDEHGNEVSVDTFKDYGPTKIRDIAVDEVHLKAVRQGMALVTEGQGTANHVGEGMGRLKIAGKTGTAEYGVAYGEDPITHDKIYPTHAWFTSYAPYENPEYVITVVLQAQPDSLQIEGTTYAAPAAKAIYQAIYGKDTRFFDPATPTPNPSASVTGNANTPKPATPTPKR